jgi:Domain of unknown function (DUF1772)
VNGVPVNLKIWELISILLSALVTGVFWRPWVALSRSISTFTPEVFLAIVNRLSRNIAPVMTVLMPVALLSMLPVLFFSFNEGPRNFYLTLAGFTLFVVALLVTVLVEVPIVKQIETWTVSTLPGNWQQLRDRWQAFHVIRVITSVAGLVLPLIGAIF